MSKKYNISNFKLLAFRALCVFALSLCTAFYSSLNAQNIAVFAGNDQTICNNDTLILSNLSANISGAVTNGYWFTSGNGTFLPSQQFNRFSLTTHYIPGQADIAAGFVNLILASDDPDGVGPMVQVTDQVRINFLGNMALVCNNSLNVSLGPDCTQAVTANMVVANMIQPTSYYTLIIKNQFNQPVPNNILTHEHIGKVLEYTVGHECGVNTCWGNIQVQDKLAPQLTCTNKTVLCSASTTPDSIGFPMPNTAKSKSIGLRKYRVTGLDACGPATLTYNDVYTDLKCVNDLQGRIARTWTAVDSFGNSSSCTQLITIKNRTLALVVLPPNFDGTTKPAFNCLDTFPMYANGHPTTDTTGVPKISGCTNIEATFTDKVFSQCGASYNLLRKWTLINWCGNTTLEVNQLIKVQDVNPPKFSCPGDITLYTSDLDCSNGLDTLPYPTNIVDCSATQLNVFINEKVSKIDFTSKVFYALNGRAIVSNLPIGVYDIGYIMEDVCGNGDTCYASITVIDNKVPVAICDQFTTVNLSTNGTARVLANSLDDGSIDNCQIASFKVAKMVDKCSNFPLVFNDYIDLCCEESNTNIMAILRVTDNFGNSNSCMVEVRVRDKIAPKIFCPSNLTISCKNDVDTSKLDKFGTIVNGQSNVTPIIINDAYNNGIAGYSGYYTDNCTAQISTTYSVNTQCNQGYITRNFVATDKDGNSAACVQVITIQDSQPFSDANVIWPNLSLDITGCESSGADVSITGKPSFTNVNCASVAATFSDQSFFNTEGVCVKILREWTVLDWCQFNAGTGKGKWTKLQTIKIKNTQAPKFTVPCKDTILCMFGENCSPQLFDFTPLGEDDCTEVQNLKSTWKIDFDSNGSFDTTATSSNVKALMRQGKHTFFYTFEDACGNKVSCSFVITAKDCKKPSPYCHTQITSALMPSAAALTIKAKSFDKASFDNCTSLNKLKFSFTENIGDSLKTLTCADIENGILDTIKLKVWVIDEQQNKDFCEVDFYLSDNDDVCQDKNLSGSIDGEILSSSGKKTQNIKVFINTNNTDLNKITNTDVSGKYTTSDLPFNQAIAINPYKNDSIMEGLSTLDILLIQRHILGSARFTNPYQIIAADIDQNKKISVSDLVPLRKVVLGIVNTFPKLRPCYTFVDKKYTFSDPNSPFPYPDTIKIPQIDVEATNSYDFVWVKVGDVNSTVGNFTNVDSDTRSRKVAFEYEVKDGYTNIYTASDFDMMGLQFQVNEVNIDEDKLLVNKEFGEYFVGQSDKFRLMITNENPVRVKKGSLLFSIPIEIEKLEVLDFNEIYNKNFEAQKIELQPREVINAAPSANIHKIKCSVQDGNIFIHTTEEMASSNIKIVDHLGRVHANFMTQLSYGSNKLPYNDLPKNQILFLELIIGEDRRVFKLYNK